MATKSPTYGATNIWDFYDLEVAHEVPCANAATFLHMLWSPSTHAAHVVGGHTGQGWADFKLFGPITDDANGWVDPKTEKAEPGVTSRTLKHEEVAGSKKYEGFEAEACLTAKYRLSKLDVEYRFASQESQDEFVARLVELGVSGNTLDRTCKTYGLRRVA